MSEFARTPRPRRTVGMLILSCDVDDDRFLRIFKETTKIVRASVSFCDRFRDDRGLIYEDGLDIVDQEGIYIEELLGLSFALLQAKIRRVSNSSERCLKVIDSRQIGSPYKETGHSLICLIWEVANYYKHSDEWSRDVWEDKKKGETESRQLKRARRTRTIVEKVGIKYSSDHNMRTAYGFFEVDWSSDCTPLADKVQEWAKAVYAKCANP
jgi:hypothetical protein